MRFVKESSAPLRSLWQIRAAVLCLFLPAAHAEIDPVTAAPTPTAAASAMATPVTPVVVPAAPTSTAQEQVPPSADPVAPAVAPKAVVLAPKAIAPVAAGTSAVRPTWTELTASQQMALRPLAGRWAEISEQQRRKWIALSQNFHKLPAPEQEKLHSRMTDWAALSAQQRNLARLNFAETNKLAPDDKKAQWEAYQALSEEEKQNLAAKAPKKQTGAATAIKPVAPQKMVVVPKPAPPKEGANAPTNRTLLPQMAAPVDARKL